MSSHTVAIGGSPSITPSSTAAEHDGREDAFLKHGCVASQRLRRGSDRSGARAPANVASAASSCGNVEIRPQRVADMQLGVREIPQQEIADAVIAAGANEQIRDRARRRAAARARNASSSIASSGSAPLATCAARRARGLHDVPAAAVTHGHLQPSGPDSPRSAPRSPPCAPAA